MGLAVRAGTAHLKLFTDRVSVLHNLRSCVAMRRCLPVILLSPSLCQRRETEGRLQAENEIRELTRPLGLSVYVDRQVSLFFSPFHG